MIRILALLIGVQAVFAAEGLILTQKIEDLQRGGEGQVTIYLEPRRVATASNEDGRSQSFVYLADEKLVRIIDHERKVYRELNEQELEKMGAVMTDAMSQVRKQMAERMKNMTPEQRAMMEKMMGGRLAQMQQAQTGAQSAGTTYQRAAGSAEIGGHACDWYDGYRQEQLATKICAADWDDFDFSADDFQVFREMAQFIGKLAPGMADRIDFGSPEDAKERYPGFPVQQTSYADGKAVTKTTMQEYRRDDIPADVYAAPGGYKREQGFSAAR